MNRIEEAAKLLFKRDCPDGDWDYTVPIQKEKWLKDARQICQLFPQPLDKELREALLKLRVDTTIIEATYNSTETYLTEYDVTQILALLQPKIEEAYKEGYDKARDNLFSSEVLAITGEALEEARRQERERIVRLLKKYGKMEQTIVGKVFKVGLYLSDWQALKGGE